MPTLYAAVRLVAKRLTGADRKPAGVPMIIRPSLLSVLDPPDAPDRHMVRHLYKRVREMRHLVEVLLHLLLVYRGSFKFAFSLVFVLEFRARTRPTDRQTE